ncbi:hypothetical protein PG2022B_0358 [Bifidobacterium animalis subsp. animalis]|nr:hypothetical protein PG2022B_0358 [Bifidobacterium animalis subsp. animalis]
MAENNRELREEYGKLLNRILDAEGDLVELESAIEDRRYELDDLNREIAEKTRQLQSLQERIDNAGL